MSKRRGNFLLLGALIGFIAGLFFAPKKGSELRRDAKNKIYGYKLTLSADYNGGDVYFVTIYPSEEDALRQLRKFSCNTWQEQTK